MLGRRQFVALVSMSSPFATAFALAQKLNDVRIQERPDPTTLQSGDFLWPKPPGGAFIPYSGTPPENQIVDAQELSEEEWTTQKFEFIKQARAATASATPDGKYLQKIADTLEAQSYTSFFNSYAGDVDPSDFQVYGAGRLLYIGHVGIVDVVEGKPYVIEAVYGTTPAGTRIVGRVSYDAWLNYRKMPLVWHGRLLDHPGDRRARIAAVAASQINKPYKFFNFDLQDSSGFYCSKLLWFSVKMATGISLDGNDTSKRLIWLSPLQAMKQRQRLELLSSAGEYRNA